MIRLTWKKLKKAEIVDLCTKERVISKWKFHKVEKWTNCVPLLKGLPSRSRDTVLPEHLLRNHNVFWPPFETKMEQLYYDNLCLFRPLALYLHSNDMLREDTSQIIKKVSLTARKDIPQNCKAFTWRKSKSQDIKQLNIFLCDIDSLNGEPIGDFSRWIIQKFDKSVKNWL